MVKPTQLQNISQIILLISPSRGKNKKSLKPAPTFLFPRISPFRTNIPSSPPALPWHNGHLKTQLLKVFLEGLGWTNSPNSITKQRNKTKKQKHRNKKQQTNQTKQHDCWTAFSEWSFCSTCKWITSYVLSRVDISMHKTCTSTVQTPDITSYHISLYDNGEHKEFVANMLSEPAWNCCWTYWEERRWPTTSKNSHWHDIFLMIKHGIAGDRLVRAYSNGSLPSLRPLV